MDQGFEDAMTARLISVLPAWTKEPDSWRAGIAPAVRGAPMASEAEVWAKMAESEKSEMPHLLPVAWAGRQKQGQ